MLKGHCVFFLTIINHDPYPLLTITKYYYPLLTIGEAFVFFSPAFTGNDEIPQFDTSTFPQPLKKRRPGNSLRHGRRARLAGCGDSPGDRLSDGQCHEASSHVGNAVEWRTLGDRGVGALHAQDRAWRLEMSPKKMTMAKKPSVVKKGRTPTFRIFGNLHMCQRHAGLKINI